MKKIALLLCASLGLVGANSASAQLQKGNLFVGGGLADLHLGLQNGTTLGFNIHPRAGYFIEDNLAIGGMVNFGFDYSSAQGTNIDYGVFALGRYYFSSEQVTLIKHARFFAEANVGFSGQNTFVVKDHSTYTNGMGVGIGPGISYFLTPNIGLEALAKYNGVLGFGNAPTAHTLSIELGFQIYLSSKKARAIYNNAAHELKDKDED